MGRMKSLHELAGRELEWKQPHMSRREFELMEGDQVVATLAFRSLLGSFATATTADGSWTFKRVGFWKPHVTVRVAGAENEVATFRNNTWSAGGTLTFPDGQALRASTNFWQSRYDFLNDADEPLVRYHGIRALLRHGATVEITAAGAKLRELPLLVTLGWYLAVKMADDAGGAAAAAAAAAG